MAPRRRTAAPVRNCDDRRTVACGLRILSSRPLCGALVLRTSDRTEAPTRPIAQDVSDETLEDHRSSCEALPDQPRGSLSTRARQESRARWQDGVVELIGGLCKPHPGAPSPIATVPFRSRTSPRLTILGCSIQVTLSGEQSVAARDRRICSS